MRKCGHRGDCDFEVCIKIKKWPPFEGLSLKAQYHWSTWGSHNRMNIMGLPSTNKVLDLWMVMP